MGQLSEYILNMVYPRRCALCHEIVMPKGQLVCPSCYTKTEVIREPKCKCCGKELIAEEQEYCFDCSKRENTWFEQGVALWHYSDTMRTSIAKFKYHARREYADFYAQEFVKEYADYMGMLELDGIIPIPVHWTRYIQRGYNQAEVLAERIGRKIGVPVYSDILLRKKKTIAQKQLDDHQRAHNLEGAFTISKKYINSNNMLNRVMIIDDIYTTGSTINACAKTLKKTGVKSVYFGVLCIGSGF